MTLALRAPSLVSPNHPLHRHRSSFSFAPGGISPNNDSAGVVHLRPHARQRRLKPLRVRALLGERDNEFTQRLIRHSEMVLELFRHLIHERELRGVSPEPPWFLRSGAARDARVDARVATGTRASGRAPLTLAFTRQPTIERRLERRRVRGKRFAPNRAIIGRGGAIERARKNRRRRRAIERRVSFVLYKIERIRLKVY